MQGQRSSAPSLPRELRIASCGTSGGPVGAVNRRAGWGAAGNGRRSERCPCRLPSATAPGRRSSSTRRALSIPHRRRQCGRPSPWHRSSAGRGRAGPPISRPSAPTARHFHCRSRSARRSRARAYCTDRPRCSSSPRCCCRQCRQSPVPDTGKSSNRQGSDHRWLWARLRTLALAPIKAAEMAAAERDPHDPFPSPTKFEPANDVGECSTGRSNPSLLGTKPLLQQS